MKKFKNVLLPAVIILLGAGAAFATNAAKNSQANVPGYYFDDSQDKCVKKRSDCSLTGSVVCTWMDADGTSHDLALRISDTSCNQILYEP